MCNLSSRTYFAKIPGKHFDTFIFSKIWIRSEIQMICYLSRSQINYIQAYPDKIQVIIFGKANNVTSLNIGRGIMLGLLRYVKKKLTSLSTLFYP